MSSDQVDVIVIGAGPAGAHAAIRAADLGARTVLVTSTEFGGMAANDGPVPVRALSHAVHRSKGPYNTRCRNGVGKVRLDNAHDN